VNIPLTLFFLSPPRPCLFHGKIHRSLLALSGFPGENRALRAKSGHFPALKKRPFFYGTFTILGMYGRILHEYWMVQDKIASNQ
jgi:hypothetical protein